LHEGGETDPQTEHFAGEGMAAMPHAA